MIERSEYVVIKKNSFISLYTTGTAAAEGQQKKQNILGRPVITNRALAKSGLASK